MNDRIRITSQPRSKRELHAPGRFDFIPQHALRDEVNALTQSMRRDRYAEGWYIDMETIGQIYLLDGEEGEHVWGELQQHVNVPLDMAKSLDAWAIPEKGKSPGIAHQIDYMRYMPGSVIKNLKDTHTNEWWNVKGAVVDQIEECITNGDIPYAVGRIAALEAMCEVDSDLLLLEDVKDLYYEQLWDEHMVGSIPGRLNHYIEDAPERDSFSVLLDVLRFDPNKLFTSSACMESEIVQALLKWPKETVEWARGNMRNREWLKVALCAKLLHEKMGTKKPQESRQEAILPRTLTF